MARGEGRCYPVSVRDDHSRFLLGRLACPDQTEATVRAQLAYLKERDRP